MAFETRAEARRRRPAQPTPNLCCTMRTTGFWLNESDILERLREALRPKPAKPRRRRERL